MEAWEQEKAASDADWETRLQEAVDSATQWKEFAEKLGKEKSELDIQLAGLQNSVQVSLHFPCLWSCVRCRVKMIKAQVMVARNAN